jgi:FlaA1/EpsC-like NDP-sugar epimerase
MVKLSGLREEEVPIVITGLRPGEKLEEELSFAYETVEQTGQPKLFRLASPSRVPRDFDEKIQTLKTLGIRMEFDEIKRLLLDIVPEYTPMTLDDRVMPEVVAKAG